MSDRWTLRSLYPFQHVRNPNIPLPTSTMCYWWLYEQTPSNNTILKYIIIWVTTLVHPLSIPRLNKTVAEWTCGWPITKFEWVLRHMLVSLYRFIPFGMSLIQRALEKVRKELVFWVPFVRKYDLSLSCILFLLSWGSAWLPLIPARNALVNIFLKVHIEFYEIYVFR